MLSTCPTFRKECIKEENMTKSTYHEQEHTMVCFLDKITGAIYFALNYVTNLLMMLTPSKYTI